MIEIFVRGSEAPALVDDDMAYLAKYKWKLVRGYAARSSGGRKIMLHHVTAGPSPRPGLVRDHMNRNRLDNRRLNLRWVTRAANNENTSVRQRNDSGYRGVRYDAQRGQYLARVQHQGRAVVRAWFTDPAAANAFLVARRPSVLPASIEA